MIYISLTDFLLFYLSALATIGLILKAYQLMRKK